MYAVPDRPTVDSTLGERNISRRTAEVHVDHILRKLKFASRAQIAAWVVEKG
ncbi:hypothetical protein DMH04_41660 [Kibdelosporangium aridum]|uniref:HTH luxR-type domain-containing protein n=1 Tax=Kibdelosporangium aridum TaxID=2030 RepID=A0A428YTV0_KIBAR|nr:LuxR C-terminal-related transcriptional regulator [Kibdelosporangium aridum]RSM72999.1 hypothetical protein DMH04_41660 [Kibdelosporangium aridum]